MFLRSFRSEGATSSAAFENYSVQHAKAVLYFIPAGGEAYLATSTVYYLDAVERDLVVVSISFCAVTATTVNIKQHLVRSRTTAPRSSGVHHYAILLAYPARTQAYSTLVYLCLPPTQPTTFQSHWLRNINLPESVVRLDARDSHGRLSQSPLSGRRSGKDLLQNQVGRRNGRPAQDDLRL